jgi:ubiquinone/menaquinone biosynthesis C-methylase UbiE
MASPDPDLDPAIAAYYEEGREEARLGTTGRVEHLRTLELLARFLPPPPARVLDVGGAAGVYAHPLIERGHHVHLLDPVPLHVDQARAAGIAHADVGDARSLPFADGAFDAVLLLGPLYHLTERSDRIAALVEAARVAGPGPVVVAAISRFASTYDGLKQGYLLDPDFEEIVERDVREGRHVNPSRHPGWFTTAYFHRPDELAAELADAGLAVDALVAVEGPAMLLPDDTWLDDPARREVLLRAIRRVEDEPAILGATGHLLAVARRHDGGEL